MSGGSSATLKRKKKPWPLVITSINQSINFNLYSIKSHPKVSQSTIVPSEKESTGPPEQQAAIVARTNSPQRGETWSRSKTPKGAHLAMISWATC